MPGFDFNPIGLGIDAASQLFKMIYGFYQIGHGSRGLKNLRQPQYSADPNILQNKQLAGQYASQGFGNQYLNFGGDAIDRNLGSTINAYTQTGQGLNAISGAQQNSNDSFQQLLMADAAQKSKNREVLINANRDLAQENLRAFDWNKAMPYQQAYNKFTNQINSGSQNIYGGGKGIGADVAAANGNGMNQQDMFKLFQQWMQSQNQSGGGYGGYEGSTNTNNYG